MPWTGSGSEGVLRGGQALFWETAQGEGSGWKQIRVPLFGVACLGPGHWLVARFTKSGSTF